MPSYLQYVKKDILKALDSLDTKVFTRKQVFKFLEDNRKLWRLPTSISSTDFLNFLLSRKILRKINFNSEKYGSKTIYSFGKVSDLQAAAALMPGAYLSHGTAAFIHDLTDQLPSIIYINREQSPKPLPSNALTQDAIDRTFKNNPRRSNYIFKFRKRRVCILSGKHTGGLEVGIIKGSEGDTLRVTKIERTLIDLAVRPQYAGGVYEVLSAYEAAKGRASSNVVITTLKKLDYVYPYHQVIGFYLSRAGYPNSSLERLKQLGMKFDFYLASAIPNQEYISEWRLYVPKGM